MVRKAHFKVTLCKSTCAVTSESDFVLVNLLGYWCNWGAFDICFVILYIQLRTHVDGALGDDGLLVVTIVLS